MTQTANGGYVDVLALRIGGVDEDGLAFGRLDRLHGRPDKWEESVPSGWVRKVEV